MERLVNDELVKAAALLVADDFTFLPGILSYQEMNTATVAATKWRWLQARFGVEGERALFEFSPKAILRQISLAYQDFRAQSGGRDPKWFQGASDPLKRYLALENALPSLLWRPLVEVQNLGLTGMGYILTHGGFTRRIAEIFTLSRLKSISQLGFLQHPHMGDCGNSVGAHFWYSRYRHSVDVTALANLVIRNNPELSPEEALTLTAAAIVHDALTAAGGDSSKMVRPDWLDEENNFPMFLSHRPVVALRKIGISPEFLTATVQGQGRLGRLLDLADKIAYVGRDAEEYLGYWRMGWWRRWQSTRYYPADLKAIADLVRANPYVCGIWDSIRVDGDQVYVEDAGRLEKFLELRSMLFQALYLNPRARFLEHIVVQVVLRFLYDHEMLTREALLGRDDEYLWSLIDQETGVPDLIGKISEINDVQVETFATLAEAVKREQELVRDSQFETHVEQVSPSLNSGISILVSVKGDLVPFRQVAPESAAVIEEQTRVTDPARLYYFPRMHISEPLLKMFEYSRQQRMASA